MDDKTEMITCSGEVNGIVKNVAFNKLFVTSTLKPSLKRGSFLLDFNSGQILLCHVELMFLLLYLLKTYINMRYAVVSKS